MSYRNEIQQLKAQRRFNDIAESNLYSALGSSMSDEARDENKRNFQMRRELIDSRIEQLEPLAQKELEQEMIQNILRGVQEQSGQLSDVIIDSLQKALDSLKL